MTEATQASSALYDRALKVMPGGVSRNTVLRKPHPLYAAKGKGCVVTDIEGVERIDFANNMFALVHGHAHPAVVEAVTNQVALGTSFTLSTELEVEYAEHLVGRTETFEKLRFVNSGTEAVMCCLKAARAFTGRTKIAKVEGAYHGLYDYAEVSQNSTPENWGKPDHPARVPVTRGTPQAALDDVVVIPFNDIKRGRILLDEHADELACIIVDVLPHRVGLVPANVKFLKALRKWATEHDVLLICDEVVTYRLSYAGGQELYDFKPDLTSMGKMIGGGFPVGALAGRADVMDVMNPLAEKVLFPHAGTFSANPITMVAGLTTMKVFDQEAVERVNKLGGDARAAIQQAIIKADVPASVCGLGSLFRIHLKQTAPTDYRTSFKTREESNLHDVFNDRLLDEGIILMNSCSGAISTVMTSKEIERLGDAVYKALLSVRPQLGRRPNYPIP